MKRKTVKQQLVDRMIAKGNSFRYSDMIAELLKVSRGDDYKYDWKTDRGYCATNFCKTSNGYMVTGVGDCGVYKGDDGKWHAKYYSKQEKLDTFLRKKIKEIYSEALRSKRVYDYNVHSLKTVFQGETYWSELRTLQNNVRYEESQFRSKIKKDIIKGIRAIQ